MQYKFVYEDKLRGKPNTAIRQGNAYHAVMEGLLLYKQQHNKLFPLDKTLQYAVKCCKAEELPQSSIDKVMAGIAHYHDALYPQHNPVQVEGAFEYEIAGVPISGRFDLLHGIGDGKAVIIDHKFSFNHWPASRAQYGPQPIIYQWAFEKCLAEKFDLTYAGFVYQVMRVFPVPSIQNVIVAPLSPEQSEWFAQQVSQMAECIKNKFFPAHPSDKACQYCDHKKLCNPVVYNVELDGGDPNDVTTM